VAPKTLAATISPLCLVAVIASLLFSPPCCVKGAHPDLWGDGIRPWQHHGGSRPWWSGSARMLRAQRQDGAGRRGSHLLACSEKVAMRARGMAQQHLHVLSEICSPRLSFLSLSDLTMSYSKARACARVRLVDGLTGPRQWQAAAATRCCPSIREGGQHPRRPMPYSLWPWMRISAGSCCTRGSH
jgi:hypothetical protein